VILAVAHLHIILLNSKSSQPAVENTKTFITTLFRTYGLHAPPPSPYFKHQVLTSHGRELVTALELFANELDEPSKQRIVKAGIRSLRAAGDSEADINLSCLGDEDNDYPSLKEGILTLVGT
jgi:hypothetical protein